MKRPIISRMTADDLDAILEIERNSFSAPWSRKLFAEELGRPWSFIRVIRDGRGTPIAYLNFWVVQDEVHVMNVATHPKHRRRGLARKLLEEMIERAAASECRLIVLEVRRSNTAAQRLYAELGFTQIGVRKGYYSDNKEDALVLELKLPP